MIFFSNTTIRVIFALFNCRNLMIKWDNDYYLKMVEGKIKNGTHPIKLHILDLHYEVVKLKVTLLSVINYSVLRNFWVFYSIFQPYFAGRSSSQFFWLFFTPFNHRFPSIRIHHCFFSGVKWIEGEGFKLNARSMPRSTALGSRAF